MITGFYGCARKHRLNYPGVFVLTNDVDKRFGCNFTCDVSEILSGCFLPGVNLYEYDFLIFTPPCNYYSKANYRREQSEYALKTRHLLPDILGWLALNYHKPFIVENVANDTFFANLFPDWKFVICGHTYWSNLLKKDDVVGLDFQKNQNKQFVSKQKRDGNHNVNIVFLAFIRKVVRYYEQISYVCFHR